MSLPRSKKTYWYLRSQKKTIERQPVQNFFLPGISKMLEDLQAGLRMFRTPEQQEAEREQWVAETQELSGARPHFVVVDEASQIPEEKRTVKPIGKTKKRHPRPCPVGPGCMECGGRHGPVA